MHGIRSRVRRGLSLIEVAMTLALAGIVTAMILVAVFDAQEEDRALQAADRLKEIRSATQDYLQANRVALLERLSGAGDRLVVPVARRSTSEQFPSGPSDTSLPSLQGGGFVPASYVDVNAYGQSHAVVVRRVPGRDRLEAVVTTTDGREIGDRSLAVISSSLGTSGGFVSNDPLPGREDTVSGTRGAWSSSIAEWTDPASSTGPRAGHAVAAIAMQENQLVEDYLYRDVVPGRPEANRMETTLSMGAGEEVNSITDLRAVENGDRAVQFGTDSFLTLRNRDTYLRLAADGSIQTSGDVEVTGNVSSGTVQARNVLAGRNASGANVTAGGELSATNARVGGADPAGGTVTATRMTVPGDASVVLDPAGTTRLDRARSNYFDLDALATSTASPAIGLRSNETIGGAVSRLWSCWVEYRFASSGPVATGNLNSRPDLSNPGTHWVRGPRLDGTSNAGAMSFLRAQRLDNECNGPGCGLQVRVNCGEAPPAVPPTVDAPDQCPPWAPVRPGSAYPDCVYPGSDEPMPNVPCPAGSVWTPPVCTVIGGSSFHWYESGFGACSAQCGGGTQTQEVYCRRTANGVRVSDDLCAASGPRPATSRTCGTDACSGPAFYQWAAGAFGACSASCGGGVQSREVVCRRISDDASMPVSFCSQSGPAPAATQACNTQACPAPRQCALTHRLGSSTPLSPLGFPMVPNGTGDGSVAAPNAFIRNGHTLDSCRQACQADTRVNTCMFHLGLCGGFLETYPLVDRGNRHPNLYSGYCRN